MDPDYDPAPETCKIDEAECEHCGGYGYLGVEDELCGACDGPAAPAETWVISADLFEGWDETPPKEI